MILAIDVGNSETDFGLWDGTGWKGLWSRPTSELNDAVEIESWLHDRFEEVDIDATKAHSICASVVPMGTSDLFLAVSNVTDKPVVGLTPSEGLGMVVRYDPPEAAGADRLANALGALARYEPPVLVIDFGTATTFDVVDADGAFIGGAIMPGPKTSRYALLSATAQLPDVPLEASPDVIGGNTVHAIQSGLVRGYAAAIQGLSEQIVKSIDSETVVVATGGLAGPFLPLCPIISEYLPHLTLEGLVEAARRLSLE